MLRRRQLLVLVLMLLGCAGQAREYVPIEDGDNNSIEERLSRIEQSLQSRGLLDLANQMDRLEQEVKRLRGELEVQTHELKRLRARLKERSSAGVTEKPSAPPADARSEVDSDVAPATPPAMPAPQETPTPEEQETAPPATGETSAPSVPPSAPPGSSPEAATPEQPAKSEQDTYKEGFEALKSGQYGPAVAAFTSYLTHFPQGKQADSAQYWLGETYFVQRQYDNAIHEYRKLLDNYPQSQKLSNAMLKIGYSYQELKQTEQAVASLNEVKQKFPGTTAARLAEERLQRITPKAKTPAK